MGWVRTAYESGRRLGIARTTKGLFSLALYEQPAREGSTTAVYLPPVGAGSRSTVTLPGRIPA